MRCTLILIWETSSVQLRASISYLISSSALDILIRRFLIGNVTQYISMLLLSFKDLFPVRYLVH